MKFFRKKLTIKSLSVFFLLIFIQSIFLPYYSFALTSGPHQAEYTSYEDGSSTDMVNLVTGNFSYNLPILEVPGPEGGFSLPLSYHAGIGLEQESSWTGLGWNMNAGSITRNINQYPDDASGETNSVTVQNLTGFSQWSRVFNYPYKDDWNSQTGHHGNINLLDIIDVDFGSNNSIGVMGVHVGDDSRVDPVQFLSAASNVVTWGAYEGVGATASVIKNAALSITLQSIANFATPLKTSSLSTSGYWKYSESRSKATEFHAKESLFLGVPIVSRKKSQHIWLDQSRNEDMYGVLYLGDRAPSTIGSPYDLTVNGTSQALNYYPKTTSNYNRGSASDINFLVDNNYSYDKQSTPTALAIDDYMVNASGVSGSITPYRLEVGSVALPRDMSGDHTRFAPIPYLNNYKVPFIYKGSIYNQYFHHVGGVTSPTSPSFYYGLDLSTGATNSFTLTDNIFKDQRIRSDIDAIKKIPQGNNIEWLTNSEIVAGLSTSQVCPSKFIDFLSGAGGVGEDYTKSNRYKFRYDYSGSNPFPSTYTASTASFSTTLAISDASVLSQLNAQDLIQMSIWPYPSGTFSGSVTCRILSKTGTSITLETNSAFTPYIGTAVEFSIEYSKTPPAQLQKGIGGFSITAANGMTYHFALPVYDFESTSQSTDVTDANKRSILSRNSAFANTWLVTAITGPDFIDRNSNGLADDGDWGYWVKMNYGKFADAYDWRIPLTGDMVDASGSFKSHEGGKKQMYYLNSIETRSHIALFMKSDRDDGKSASGTIGTLKLDEICLLKKEHYNKLVQSFSITDYTNNTFYICNSSQFAVSNVRDYVNKNCVKRVCFTYSYDLCKNTPNAVVTTNNPAKGKLTLKAISIKGKGDLKITPDFKFEYANNPDYNASYWDGWGFYNSNGGSGNTTSHQTSLVDSDGAAWSLSKITTPLGSNVLINYERDTYSTISGNSVWSRVMNINSGQYTTSFNTVLTTIPVNPGSTFLVGDLIRIRGNITYYCPGATTPNTKTYGDDSNMFNVVAISSNSITVNGNYMGIAGDCSTSNFNNPSTVVSHTGYIEKVIPKKGGDIRVSSIVSTNEWGETSKISYQYNTSDGKSYGDVSQEPDYVKTYDLPFYGLLRYPQTPVMYNQVTVINGNDNNPISKQVFAFETLNTSHFSATGEDHGTTSNMYKKLYRFEDFTSRIGKLTDVFLYDRNNQLISSTQLTYNNQILNNEILNENDVNAYQGVFSEGTLLVDRTFQSGAEMYHLNRTTILTYPSTLKKIVTSKDGFTTTTENKNWDLITGIVTQKLDKSSLGLYTKTITKLAYNTSGYNEMGSKAFDVNNKNMLSQSAANYVYRSDVNGSLLGLLGAEVQTWKKDWNNYRIFNASNQTYGEGTESDAIWRKGASYIWKGSFPKFLAHTDGTQTFSTGDDFNFSNVSNPLWFKKNELLRFDHFGMVLESVDYSGIYSASKMGYDNRFVIASATNAKYNEMAFSGAEDNISGTLFFGGEVSMGSGTTVSTPVHTGLTALSLSSGYGFVFKSSGISPNKTYRASVWTSSTNGRIYYKINNGAEVSPTPVISQAVTVPGGTWYKIDLSIPIGNISSPSIEVGVKSSTGSTVIFDDFRFQPADAVMTCYVYPPLNFEFTTDLKGYSYTLDNDNLYSKYESAPDGSNTKMYVESVQYHGEKLISESKKDFRRFHVDQ